MSNPISESLWKCCLRMLLWQNFLYGLIKREVSKIRMPQIFVSENLLHRYFFLFLSISSVLHASHLQQPFINLKFSWWWWWWLQLLYNWRDWQLRERKEMRERSLWWANLGLVRERRWQQPDPTIGERERQRREENGEMAGLQRKKSNVSHSDWR